MSDETEEKKVITRAQAKALGLSRYFTGKPCKHGHVAERYVVNLHCVDCASIRMAKYYESDRERNAEVRKAWAKNNPEKRNAVIQNWRKNNPEKERAIKANRSAQKRQIGGKFTAKDIERMLFLQNKMCNACGLDISQKYHVDHIVALSKGGSNWPWNLQLLCPACNVSKHDKDYEEWKASRFKCE